MTGKDASGVFVGEVNPLFELVERLRRIDDLPPSALQVKMCLHRRIRGLG